MTSEQKSKRPPDNAFRQQKLASWQPIMTPIKVVAIFFAVGISFIPAGTTMMKASNNIFESTIFYDGPLVAANSTVQDCQIKKNNEGRQCTITFTFDREVNQKLYLYYKLDNYYQNHRLYVSSRNAAQLGGEVVSQAVLQLNCQSELKNGSLTLNPCGLIANSFFTDIISLSSSQPSGFTLDENDISWPSDQEYKYLQPSGFQSAVVSQGNCTQLACAANSLPSGCKCYYDTRSDEYYLFYYPNDDTTQYLYESYPDQISPIEGVTNEHFIVWMRTAGLPTFRKLYGSINGNFKPGDTLTFTVTANYEVSSFGASKGLQISEAGEFGGRNAGLGVAYVVVGSISLFFGAVFGLKHVLQPRALGDATLLGWD